MYKIDQQIYIFGYGSTSHQILYVLNKQGLNVTGYIVDDTFQIKKENSVQDNVFTTQRFFECLPTSHSNISMHVAIGYAQLNQIRANKVEYFKNMNFILLNIIDQNVSIKSVINPNTNCLILSGTSIDVNCVIGSNVAIKSNVTISHDNIIGDNVFIANGVTTGGHVSIGKNSFVGLGSVVNDHIAIAENCFIGSGCVVNKDTESGYIYVGNPARKLRPIEQ